MSLLPIMLREHLIYTGVFCFFKIHLSISYLAYRRFLVSPFPPGFPIETLNAFVLIRARVRIRWRVHSSQHVYFLCSVGSQPIFGKNISFPSSGCQSKPGRQQDSPVCCLLNSGLRLSYSLIPKMEVTCSSETSVYFQLIIWRYITEVKTSK
jgi:hypothetical protein